MTNAAQNAKIGSLQELEKETGGDYQRWEAEIEAAEKELQKWQRYARKIVKEYRAEHAELSQTDPSMQRKFNLFAANVNILKTSLINEPPEVSINREFRDTQDKVGRVACNILERAVSSHNNRNDRMFSIIQQAVQDMLVPGAGTTWHTYQATTEHFTEEPDAATLALDPQAKGREYDEVVQEELRDEYVYWEDLIWSPARCWQEVRWAGRKVYLTKDQNVERFGEELAKDIPLNYSTKKEANAVGVKNPVFQQTVVYEIWDKEGGRVIWFVKGMDKLCDEKEDFLELQDFFPMPKPMFANLSNGQMVPIPDYTYAKDQYKELNEINTRIGLLVKACRVAGVYDKANPALKDLVNNAAENTLVPADNWAMFAEKGGIKGAIDFFPLEQIVATIDQLMKAREDVKTQIYEITGMADIIRGQSKATETLGAQKIKAQYASMRIQDRQKQVVTFSSGAFDIQTQLMRKHMSVEEISKLAQVQFMDEDQQLIQQALQLIKTPEFQLRARVTSDTLSDIDFQAEKQDRMEYMTAITNFLKETGQAMTADPLLGPLLMQLLQFSLAGFKVGKKFEGELDRTFQQIMQKLSQPQQPQMTPDQAKVAQIQQETQANQQDRQGEQAHQQAMQQIELQGKQQNAAVDKQIADQKLQQSQAQFWTKMRQDAAKAQQQAVQQTVGGNSGSTPVSVQ